MCTIGHACVRRGNGGPGRKACVRNFIVGIGAQYFCFLSVRVDHVSNARVLQKTINVNSHISSLQMCGPLGVERVSSQLISKLSKLILSPVALCKYSFSTFSQLPGGR